LDVCAAASYLRLGTLRVMLKIKAQPHLSMSPCIPTDRPFLSIHEVATILGRHVRTVHRLISAQDLQAHKFRGRWVVKPECLERFLKKLETNF
jgi:excisionase family DNA binding protein